MGWVGQWRKWRRKGLFASLGAECSYSAPGLEVKGNVALGNRCILGGNVTIRTHKQGLIRLHDDVELSDYALLSSNNLLEIGPESFVGPYCVLRDTNHLVLGTEVHWRLTPQIIQPIIVGAQCYIGACSYIMPGVTLEDGAVVAPGSLVKDNVGSFELWGGSPARFIAHRTDMTRRSGLKRQMELAELFGPIAQEHA